MKRQWISETARAVRNATGLNDPVQGAILLAEELTQSCNVLYGAESLDLLASTLDAKIQATNLGQESGQLVPPANESEPFLILVNEAHPLRRRNFSASHEMGHLLMPNYSPDQGIRRDWDTMRFNPQNEEEFLCDVAAAEILMPRRHFKPRLFHEGVGIDAVFTLSQEFNVSLEACLFNVVSGCGADVAGIVWELDYDKKDALKAANGSLDLGSEWEPVVEKKWRVSKSLCAGAMGEFNFLPRRSATPDSITGQAGSWMAQGSSTAARGIQLLKPVCGEREFFVESRGYSFRRDVSGDKAVKVISLVWLQEPTDN